MRKLLILNGLFVLFCTCLGQRKEFTKLANNYDREIELPIKPSEINDTVYIDKILLNELLFEKQSEDAKFYTYTGDLMNVTTYGKIPEDIMKWRTWADETHTKRIEKAFEAKAYALGNIELDENHIVWMTKIIGFQKTYIDLYVFSKEGKLKSLINLYEAEYESNGDPSKIEKVLIQSEIEEDGTIDWKEDRFSVETNRRYKLLDDGYFKIIFQEQKGGYVP